MLVGPGEMSGQTLSYKTIQQTDSKCVRKLENQFSSVIFFSDKSPSFLTTRIITFIRHFLAVQKKVPSLSSSAPRTGPIFVSERTPSTMIGQCTGVGAESEAG